MRSFWRRSMPHWRRVAGRRWNGCRGCCRGEAQMTALSLPPASWREFDDICRVVLHRLGLSMEDHRWCRRNSHSPGCGSCKVAAAWTLRGSPLAQPRSIRRRRRVQLTSLSLSLPDPGSAWHYTPSHWERHSHRSAGSADDQDNWGGSVRWWRWARCFTLPSAQEGCTAFW